MKIHFEYFVLALAIAGVTGSVSVAFSQQTATSNVTPEMRTVANDAYQKQNRKAAVDAYEKIVKEEEKNAGAN